MFRCKIVRFSLLLMCLVYSVNSYCENKDALNDVTAFIHYNQKLKGTTYTGNFYDMEKYAKIDFKRANVTELCEGMIKNFPNLEVLNLINVNISKIQANAFQHVPKLNKLSLAINNISELLDGNFNNLDSLEILYLSGNIISSIQSGVFQSLPNLKNLYLDRNKLTQLGEDLFSKNPLLSVLDLRYNLIETVDKNVFPQLKLSHSNSVTIFLGHNRIKDVDPAVFTFKNPINLHLENNKLNTITDMFHRIPDYSVLYLNSNQYNCLPSDVIENVQETTKTIYLLDNPLNCECLRTLHLALPQELDGNEMGNLIYSSIFPCELFKF